MSKLKEEDIFFHEPIFRNDSLNNDDLAIPLRRRAPLEHRTAYSHDSSAPRVRGANANRHNERDGDLLYWLNHPDEDDLPTPFANSFPEPPDYYSNISEPVSAQFRSGEVLEAGDGDDKGKGKAVVVVSEDEFAAWDATQEAAFDIPIEEGDGLTRQEKDEQSRRDAEWSLMLLAQELLEEGVPQEEIASYVYQSQVVAAPTPLPLLQSPFQSPKTASLLDDKLDLDHVARLTVDGIATRLLPPAYGPDYSPEPSTSQAGSPILAVRRASISSVYSSASMTSASSAAPSSTYTSEEEEELIVKMQRFLDERYEANKAAILSDVEHQERKRKRSLEQTSRKDGWRSWRHHFGIGQDDEMQLTLDGLEGQWVQGPADLRFPMRSQLANSDNTWSLDRLGGHRSPVAVAAAGVAARDRTTSRATTSLRRMSDQYPPSYYFAAGTRYQGL